MEHLGVAEAFPDPNFFYYYFFLLFILERHIVFLDTLLFKVFTDKELARNFTNREERKLNCS